MGLGLLEKEVWSCVLGVTNIARGVEMCAKLAAAFLLYRQPQTWQQENNKCYLQRQCVISDYTHVRYVCT